MVRGSTSKLVLDGHGSYRGMEKGCFVVKDKKGNSKRYPLFENEISEVILKSGNMVSTGALASLGFWDVDVLILTQREDLLRCSRASMTTLTLKPESLSMRHSSMDPSLVMVTSPMPSTNILSMPLGPSALLTASAITLAATMLLC